MTGRQVEVGVIASTKKGLQLKLKPKAAAFSSCSFLSLWLEAWMFPFTLCSSSQERAIFQVVITLVFNTLTAMSTIIVDTFFLSICLYFYTFDLK